MRHMFTILETEEFSVWLAGLKDPPTRARLLKRMRRAALGHLGDVKPVGQGVFEMREAFGPGLMRSPDFRRLPP